MFHRQSAPRRLELSWWQTPGEVDISKPQFPSIFVYPLCYILHGQRTR